MPRSKQNKTGPRKPGVTRKTPVKVSQVVTKRVGQNYTPEQMADKKQLLCELFELGTTSLRKAAALAHMSPDTILIWKKKDPKFAAALIRAQTISVEVLESVAYRNALKSEEDPRYQTALFKFLEAKHPEWRHLKEKNNQQNMSIAMQIYNMSEEELMRMTAIVPPIQALP